MSSVGSCAAPGLSLRLKSREATTRYPNNSRLQYQQEEKKTLLDIIPEDENQFFRTSIEVPVPDEFSNYEPKKKKGFHEEEHSKMDNMHPATLFEAFFPKQEKSEKKKPEPEHYYYPKPKDIDMRKKMRQDRETVDHSREKKLNAERVENHIANIIEREEDVPDYRNMPHEKTVKPEKARRQPKDEHEEKLYQCPFCNRRVRSSKSLKRHLEQIHIGEIIQETKKEAKSVTPFSPDYRRHLENLPNVFFFSKDGKNYVAYFVEKEMAKEKSQPEAVSDSESTELPIENGTSSFNTGPVTIPVEENSSHEAPLTGDSALTVPVDHDAGEAHQLDVEQLHQGYELDLTNQHNTFMGDTKNRIYNLFKKKESRQTQAAENIETQTTEADNIRADHWKESNRGNGTAKACKQGFAYLKQVISPI